MRAERIPCAPVNDFEHALSEPQITARNMVVEVETSFRPGSVRMPGSPIKYSLRLRGILLPAAIAWRAYGRSVARFRRDRPGKIVSAARSRRNRLALPPEPVEGQRQANGSL